MVVDKTFYTPRGRLFVFKTKDENFIEGVELRELKQEASDIVGIWNNLTPVSEKILIGISSQIGCPFSCKFCNSGKFPYKRNLDYEELLEQIEIIIGSIPELKSGTKKAKLGFVRMGEPAFNVNNILKVIFSLRNTINWLPCYNSVVPKKIGIDALLKVIEEKELGWNGNLNIQISAVSTNENTRKKLIGSGIESLDDIIKTLDSSNITGRKIALNFLSMTDCEISANFLKKLDPEKYIIKISALNNTQNAKQNNLFYSETELKNIGLQVITTQQSLDPCLCCGQNVSKRT